MFSWCGSITFLSFRHAGGMALGMASLVGPPCGSHCNISTIIRWFAMKFGAAIHGPQRMKPVDSGDLTFSLVPPWGSFLVLSEMFWLLLDWLTKHLVHRFMCSLGWIVLTLVDPKLSSSIIRSKDYDQKLMTSAVQPQRHLVFSVYQQEFAC